jgi:4-hydroxy-tetrahydrodipicolinate synthase
VNEQLNQTTLWTAVVTPMLSSGQIDWDSFETNLKAQSDAGNGVLVLGSTGEALSLSRTEREEVVNFAIKLNLSTPLMCGVGGINIEETLDWVKFLESVKLDAYLVVSPLYMKAGRHGQTKWFNTILDQCSRAVMLYNVPSRTGGKMNPQSIADVSGHKSFWSIKEASGSTSEFEEFVTAASKQKVLSGDDAYLPSYVPLGAKGLVSVASNCWPKETNLYATLALEGKLTPEEIKMWHDCSEALFCAPNPTAVKSLMKDLGLITDPQVRLPLDPKDLDSDNPLQDSHEQIQQWYSNKMRNL